MIFIVAFTGGTIFTALLAYYATQKGNPDDVQLQKLKLFIIVAGIIASVVSLFCQILAVNTYKFFSRVYLRPIVQELGLAPKLSVRDLKYRRDVDVSVGVASYGVCVVYLLTWLLVLYHDLKNFG